MSGHAHPSTESQRHLTAALGLALAYLVAEVVGGLLSGSLALLADAGHMLSDAASLGLALLAIWIGRRPASRRFSYGFRRAEVLAALVNAVALLVVAGAISWEAYRRLRAPPQVDGSVMFGVASGGLLVNLIMLRLLSCGRSESLNVEGAWLHVLTDLIGSIGAVISGLVVWLGGHYWVDPVASVLIVILVFGSGLSLLRRTAHVLMEGTPDHIDADAVRGCIADLAEVEGVHHVHVWTITGGEDAMSAHVLVSADCAHDDLLKQIRATLAEAFRIRHVTIQFEHESCGDEQH
jgi:cobalt-zinc-cadmium efflux system protein